MIIIFSVFILILISSIESFVIIAIRTLILLKLFLSKKNVFIMLLILEVIIIIAIIIIVSSHFSLYSLPLALTVFTLSVGEASLALALLINLIRKTQSAHFQI